MYYKGNNMNLKMLKAALAGLVLSVSGFANAGLITVGDIDNLNWNPTNDFFYDNIRNGASDILWLDSGSGNLSTTSRNIDTRNRWIGDGATIVDNNSISLGGVNLNDYGLIVYTSAYTKDNFFDIAATSKIGDYVQGGGQFLYVAQAYGAQVADHNSFLASIGSTISYTGNGAGSSGEIVLASPFTAGGESFDLNGVVELTGGTGDIVIDSSGRAGIVYETFAVPEPSTLAIFALGIMGLAARRFKK
jgi:hypothetical protein